MTIKCACIRKDVSSISRAILVRVIFACFALVSISRVVDGYGLQYWSLTVLLVPLIAEGIYRLKKFNGVESSKWFCLCVLFFLIPNVTCIWLLQTKYNRCILNYNSTGRFKEDCEGEDIEITFEKIFGVRVAIPQLSHLRWIMSIQQAMIILLVIGRCLLPNKLVDRFRLARLLLVLIANGADVIEFYQTQSDMKIEKVRDTEIYVLLAFWTWSLVPFCFYLTATEDRDDETPEVEQKATTEQTDGNQTKNSKYINILIDERWSLLFQCLCMDGPYLAMRLYIMSTYKLFTSSILFFVAKNAILLIVDLYLFFLLCCSDERKAARKAKQRAIELKKSNTSVLPVLIQKA